MPKKRIIVTSRGLKLDMDALKASQPNVKPIVTGKGKEKPVKTTPKNVAIHTKTVRINATVPAKRPTPTAAIVEPATAIPEQELNRPAIVTQVVEPTETIVDSHKATTKKIKEQ